MDLKEFIKIIKSNIIFLLLFALIGAIIGFSSKSFFSSGYLHTQTYFLADPTTQINPSQSVQSERYFHQEKARNFTDTAIAILDSPDFKSEVLNGNGTLTVRKIAPQVIKLTYISSNPDPSNSNLLKVSTGFNKKIQELAESSPAAQLKQITNPPQPSYSSLNSRILTLVGAIFGFTFALFIISVKNYFKL